MHVLHVVGARPNFMKAAPVIRALANRDTLTQSLVHTGQHYDNNMSDVFFRQLDIPTPDVNLGVGSGSHARQTAQIMTGLEDVFLERQPDTVVVYGDVNSTVAAALVCSKLGIRIAHVEAGLRSFDRTMPEEINRIVTDRLSDVLFTPSEDADRNLLHEGVEPDKISRVGNVMIDSLIRLLPAARAVKAPDLPSRYALVTLHRPSNVDDLKSLRSIVETLSDLSRQIPILFPVHPRTRQRLAGIDAQAPNIRFLDPLPYIEFLSLQLNATVIMTDSGGIQEESTYLGIPCLTMRENTERPITVEVGTNILVGSQPSNLRRALEDVLEGNVRNGTIPPLWDGHAGERIAEVLDRVPVEA